MSNLYKELVQEIAKSWRYFVYKPSPGEEQCLCFFCHAEFGCPHEPSCLVEQAKTLLAQNPDSEEENPWIPCSERMPEEVGYYPVTYEDEESGAYKVDRSVYFGERQSGEKVWFGVENVIAWLDVGEWMNKLLSKPYQPPAPKPEPDNQNRAKVVGTIKKVVDTVTAEPPKDPLMGWIPEWKEPPNTKMDVKVLVQDDQHQRGVKQSVACYDFSSKRWFKPNSTTLLDGVLAWKECDPTPDPKLFEKPTSPPPKHQSFALQFVPFEEQLPTKPGYYYLHNADTDQWHPHQIDDPQLDQWLVRYSNYTHWALVTEGNDE